MNDWTWDELDSLRILLRYLLMGHRPHSIDYPLMEEFLKKIQGDLTKLEDERIV